MQDLQIQKEMMLELMKNLDYSDCEIKKNRIILDRFINYISSNSLPVNIDTAHTFCSSYFDLYSTSRKRDYCLIKSKRAVLKFIRYLETGEINSRWIPTTFKLSGIHSVIFEKYLDNERKRLKQSTFSNYRHVVHDFHNFLINNDISIITSKCISDYFLDFIKTNDHPHAFYLRTSVLKKLLLYLFENKYINDNLLKSIPKAKYIRTKKLPSTYTNAEISKMLSVIDRNSTAGKRDYAMISLAVHLGLRAGDIVNLKFENIDWERNRISLLMSKTGKEISLPLLPEVGNAILDYLKNSRRDCSLKEIFVSIKGEILPVKPTILYEHISNYLKMAGIDTSNRKKGPHALRHSLATRMLKQGQPLPLISEALGHSDSQVTMIYTSIDFDSLKDCALEVLPIKSSLYAGGIDNAS